MEACSRVSESGWHTTCVAPGRLLTSDDDSERTCGTSPPVHGLIEQSGAGSGQYAGRSTCASAVAGASTASAHMATNVLTARTDNPPMARENERGSLCGDPPPEAHFGVPPAPSRQPPAPCGVAGMGLRQERAEAQGREGASMGSRMGAPVGTAIALAVVLACAGVAQGSERLEMYTLKGRAADIAKGTQGVELAGQRRTASGIQADAVLTADQVAKLKASGVQVTLKRNKKGQTVTEQARAMAAGGFNVYRSWDEAGGIRDELHQIASQNPQIVKLEVLGRTYQGRELLALKVTQSAGSERDGSRPAVLYSSNQHAREWISLEVNRRLMHYFIDRWRAGDPEIRGLLKSTELWFVISANPDGYQYTFDHERLWRKNLRDNNGDGQITAVDGVDPNRNFNEHWGFDNEGSSPDQADETYRGPSAASEPETQAMQGLIKRIKPRFQSNMHSFGPWLLYPQGWQ